ncbi:MAG: alkaline phosphatase family protein [Polyangiaceae bacterium]|nr:alkaline phosphatase family protein [Polyangiaceae bacterium]
MPLIRDGLLKGFYLPDYDGGSIVNLLASIIRSRGGWSPHRELSGLPANRLAHAKNVVYVLVDGMGEAQLEALLDAGEGRAFFAEHERQVISTVFPATTASAVTTLATGATPREHAIIGWHLHLHDLGLDSTILKGTTRTGQPMVGPDFDLDAYLALPSHLDTAQGRRELLTPTEILRSRYSTAGTLWHRGRSYKKLAGLERQIVAFARRRGRGLAYAYWPNYDGYCHEFGCTHRVARQHLVEIDDALGRLVQRLAGTDTMLLVLADHGLVDTRRDQRVELSAVEGLYDCLATLPSGDTREVSCFVRPAKVEAFLSIVKKRLGATCVCIPGEDLIRLGAFGDGAEHPALGNRLGDYVLLARGAHAFNAAVAGSSSGFHVGNHGGMSEREVRVPLYAVHC